MLICIPIEGSKVYISQEIRTSQQVIFDGDSAVKIPHHLRYPVDHGVGQTKIAVAFDQRYRTKPSDAANELSDLLNARNSCLAPCAIGENEEIALRGKFVSLKGFHGAPRVIGSVVNNSKVTGASLAVPSRLAAISAGEGLAFTA